MATRFDAAARSLIDRGYAIFEDDGTLLPLVHTAFLEGLRFFAQPEEAKRSASTPKIIEGYLPMGSEFSALEERPDLCESFAVWCRNAEFPEVRRWAAHTPLHMAMTAALPIYTAVANAIFEALRQRINPQGSALLASEASYLQINHYRPVDHERDLLQDPHEDGHLLTILRPTTAGAEVLLGKEFVRIEIPENGFLLMPGSLLTFMTGGLILTLIHRVRNDRTTSIRQSLMYFINPTMRAETLPWIESEINQGISIRSEAIRNSSKFGLPSLEEAQME